MRRALPLVTALAILAGLASPSGPRAAVAAAEPDLRPFIRAACELPREWLERMWNGSRDDRGSDIIVVPKQPATLSLGFTHSGPWEYLQQVPLLWYGPGHVRPGTYRDRVTLADVAPTIGAFVGYDFPAPDGRALNQAIADAERPPRLVLTVVLDGAGRIVLDEWPDSWPFLRKLKEEGAWFDRAEVGSTPSATAQVHATIGTGAFPRSHGMVGNKFRVGNRMVGPWPGGPNQLLLPTIGDLYDLATENRALIGGAVSVIWHMGMVGHGAFWGGGDQDVAFTHAVRGDGSGGVRWGVPRSIRDHFRFPAYVNRLPGYEPDVRRVDQADGQLDGLWRTRSIARLRHGWDTPARLPAQTRAITETIAREGFGADDVPDLLFVNYKLIDHIGHLFSLNSLEMRDTVEWQDRELRTLVRFLDREVGRGEWVMAVTADHGHTPDPAVTGAFRISPSAVDGLLRDRFGEDVILAGTPSDYYLDPDVLKAGGNRVEDVAAFLTTITKAQTKAPNATLSSGEADQRVFEAVIPKFALRELPCLPEARG